jgi:hypothetical protein
MAPISGLRHACEYMQPCILNFCPGGGGTCKGVHNICTAVPAIHLTSFNCCIPFCNCRCYRSFNMPATGDQPLTKAHGDMGVPSHPPPAPGPGKVPLTKPPRVPKRMAHKNLADIINNTRPVQLAAHRTRSQALPAQATTSVDVSETMGGSQSPFTPITARYLPIQRLVVLPVKASADEVPRKTRTTRHGPHHPTATHWGRKEGGAAIVMAQETLLAPVAAAAGGGDATPPSRHLKRPAAEEEEEAPKATPQQLQRRRASPAAAPAVRPVAQQAATQQQVVVEGSNRGTSHMAAAGGGVSSSTWVREGSQEGSLMAEAEDVAAAALMALGTPAAEGPQQQAVGRSRHSTTTTTTSSSSSSSSQPPGASSPRLTASRRLLHWSGWLPRACCGGRQGVSWMR